MIEKFVQEIMTRWGYWLRGLQRSYQIRTWLKQGDRHHAAKVLKQQQETGWSLSALEKTFAAQLRAERLLQDTQRELRVFKRQSSTHSLPTRELEPNAIAMANITQQLKLVQIDETTIQVTGLVEEVFHPLEETIAVYIKEEFARIPKRQLKLLIRCALMI